MREEKKQFSAEEPSFYGRHICYLYRRSSSYFTAAFKPLGLSIAQSIVLIGIYRYDGLHQCSLAESVSMEPGVVSRILRELEDRGYVTKQRSDSNRRNYNLFLTPSGEALAEQSLVIQGDYWSRLISDFTPAESETLNAFLRKMDLCAYEIGTEG